MYILMLFTGKMPHDIYTMKSKFSVHWILMWKFWAVSINYRSPHFPIPLLFLGSALRLSEITSRKSKSAIFSAKKVSSGSMCYILL